MEINRQTPIKRLGIIFTDKLSINMFTDFLKHTYLEGHELTMLSYSLYNTIEYAQIELAKLPKVLTSHKTDLVLIKGSKTINEENPIIKISKEKLDQLIILKQRDIFEPVILKGSRSLQPVIARWKINLARMAKVQSI